MPMEHCIVIGEVLIGSDKILMSISTHDYTCDETNIPAASNLSVCPWTPARRLSQLIPSFRLLLHPWERHAR